MVAISEARCPDYPRFVYSALLLIFSCTITFYAIIEQKVQPNPAQPSSKVTLTVYCQDELLALRPWLGRPPALPPPPLLAGSDGGTPGTAQPSPAQPSPVPSWLSLFVVQVALVELKRQNPQTYRHSHPRAYKLGQAAQKSDNVEKFLMGRQMFVVFIVFFSAKLTTIHSDSYEDFLFPIPDWFRTVFLETGILACVLVVILAQLMPQIVAAHYPVAFLEFSIMKYGYYACIFLEWTGGQQTTRVH